MTECSPIDFNAAAIASTRRGVCPALDAPMQTGDGLLVRLRPLDSRLTPAAFVTIAETAARHGNGLMEVTARGNLQVRGLTPASAPLFSAEILAMDMPLATGLAIETPPLAGLDPEEIIDARPLADVLRARVVLEEPALSLAAKLSITVDGGGRFSLQNVSADIRLTALPDNTWEIALAGDDRTAKPVACLPADAAVDAVMARCHAETRRTRQPVGGRIDADERRDLQGGGVAHDLDHQVGADVARADYRRLYLWHPAFPWRTGRLRPWHGRRPMSGNLPKLAAWEHARFLDRAIFDRKSPPDALAAARRAYCLVPALRLSTRLARDGARLISVAGQPDANE